MAINYELYKIFYHVANNKNITNAAKELNISQPAISKAIKNLEDQLGGSLFIRTKRGVLLTKEGEEFYHYIKEAIEYIRLGESKYNEMRNLEVGTIRIGVNTTLTKKFLLPFLCKFRDLYPSINIEIVTGVSNQFIPKIRNGFIDLAILSTYEGEKDKDITYIDCGCIHDCFIVGNKYKDLVNKEFTLKELNNYPLILERKGSNIRRFIDDFAIKNNVILKPTHELASYSLVAELTKEGFGIGFMTKEFIKDEINKKELYILKIKEKIPYRKIVIAISKNQEPNFSTKKLIEIITAKDI